MAENKNKYVSPSKLSIFLDNLKNIFSPLVHSHKISDIIDYSVDLELSSTSNNPVANSVLDAEFEAISQALNVYDSVLDEKANISHIHEIGDINNLQNTIDVVNDTVAQKSQVQVVTSETSEILSTLKIHRLTKEEYEQAVANGTIEENSLYLTPDEEADLSNYATIEQLNTKADSIHAHDDRYYTEAEIDELIISHTHDSSYDAYGSANAALKTANTYTDNAVAQKSQVQIFIWEADD